MIGVNLKTEHMTNPIGLDVQAPLLSWNCKDDIRQTAYEIAAFSDEREVWDSGKVQGNSMQCIFGEILVSKQSIQWKVRLWNEKGECGEWSEPALFEMGILDKALWKAKWIEPEQDVNKKVQQPASIIRKSFEIKKKGKARLYITCHGIYVAYINGKRVGDFVLAPGTSEYTKRLPYQTLDVTEYVQDGANEIVVELGDGWWRGGNGIAGTRNLYGTKTALLCQLEVDELCVLISDEDWEASQDGMNRSNDLQMGEVCDANYVPTEWHRVQLADYGYENLVCTNSVPIREQESLPATMIKTPKGEVVLDFGQNMAGYVEFDIIAKRGQRIVLTHAEALDDEGNFSEASLAVERQRKEPLHQKIEYICRDGKNNYKPQFCIFGFQYVKVETDINVKEEDFVAHVVHSDMEVTGDFISSDERVNKLVKNTLWSQKSNFCDIPTDCPTRERCGWSGDAGVFVSTGAFLTDCYPIFRKWLREFSVAQAKNGKASNIAPRCGNPDFFTGLYEGSTGWGDACVIIPYTLYKYYGDKKILEENYETMKKWLQFSEKRAHKSRLKNYLKKNPYRKYTIDKGIHWGEWLEPSQDMVAYMKEIFSEGAPEVATAYYSYSSRLFSEIATVLGREQDAIKYKQIAEKARAAYRYTQLPDGIINSKRQCRYVRPIAMQLLEKAEAVQAAKDLNYLVIENDYHLNTGFLSTPYICQVLADYGYVETAYRLLLQNTNPSWLFAVEHGANTIWESWEGNIANASNASLNHYSKGAVVAWLFHGVCGIKVNGQNLEIVPKPCALLEYARAEYKSPIGVIKSEWRYVEDRLEFKFDIPVNVCGKISLPNGEVHEVETGMHCFNMKIKKQN